MKIKTIHNLIWVLITVLLSNVSVNADWPETAQLLASDGIDISTVDGKLGCVVSIDGDYAVIGDPSDGDNGSRAGAAYIFRYNGAQWIEEKKLTASDGEAFDQFGVSVAMSGNTVVIGAYEDDEGGVNDCGSAYIFKRKGSDWAQQPKLLASDKEAGDEFGKWVSISGNTVIVGAPENWGQGNNSGAAYIFREIGTQWVQEQKLTNSIQTASGKFGSSVAISGDTTIIGAYENHKYGEGGAPETGSASIYHYNGSSWEEQLVLYASDASTGDCFGYSVSISGDTAIVGAYQDDDNGDGSGSAYIFTCNGTTWEEQDKMVASDADADDWFGYAVSICGDTAVVGACMDEDTALDAGSAYIFQYTGSQWAQQTKLLASDGLEGDRFGLSVVNDDNYALIAAPRRTQQGTDGTGYIFDKPGPTVSFSYQGRLMDNAIAADGLYDFQFKLYDDPTPNGLRVGNWFFIDDITVTNGYFLGELSFKKSVFTGEPRWLEIAVRPGASTNMDDYMKLSPLQQITLAPYAYHADDADYADSSNWNQLVNVPSGFADGVDNGIESWYDMNDIPPGFADGIDNIGTGGTSPWQINGSDIYYTNGNVGIGTVSPNEKLDVTGNIKASGNVNVSGNVDVNGNLTTGNSPGCEFTDSVDSLYLPFQVWSNIRSVSLTLNAPGYVIVTFSGTFEPGGLYIHEIYVGIDTTNAPQSDADSQQKIVTPSGGYGIPFSVQHVYSIPSVGSYTYYGIARPITGDIHHIKDAKMTAIYVPNRY